MNLGDALPLIPERIIEISDLIDLEGMYSKIWKDFTVLVIANNGLDEKQLDVIHCFLRKLPTEIHDLRYITVDKMLEDIEKHPVSLEVNTPAVNIFDNRVGLISENGFPDDVPPFYSDLFSLALAHEVNHRVHSTFSRTSQSLKNRRNELIKAAGSNQMNYLRSTLAAGFFITNSQEFFASISNQWFANTERTLELALIRWNNGYKDPINQFLFFAEVYSKGGNTVPFYIMDVQGNLSCIEITVNRNVHGHIDTLCVGENTYKFSLNISGDVLGIYH